MPQRRQNLDQVSRGPFERQAQQVLQLADGDDQRDADGEALDHRFRDERDEPAGAKQPSDDKDHPGHHGGEQQAVEAMLLDDAVHDDDEGPGRAADLDPAAAKQGDQETADDRGYEARFGIRSGSDGDRHAQGKRDEGDRNSGKRVAEQQAPGISAHGGEELGFHPTALSGVDVQFNTGRKCPQQV